MLKWNRFAALLLASAATLAHAASDVVISQVYGGGGNAGATLRNDFIEIFNRGAAPVALGGWSVQYASAAGTTWQVTPLPGISLAPGQYLLVQEAAGTGGSVSLPAPDASGNIAMSATAGKVALVSNTTPLTCADSACLSDPDVRDLVGYGPGATNFEVAPTPANLSNTTAALRAGAGCADSDGNAADFANGAPAPRNSAAPLFPCANPIASCPASLPALSGFAAQAKLSAADHDGRVASAQIVSAPVPGVLLAGFVPADTDGAPASVFLQVATATAIGTYSIDIRFSNADPAPQSATCTVLVTVADPTPSARIRTIQGAAHISPLNGQPVRLVPGIVTAVRANGFHLQDPEPDADPATSEGLFVFSGSAPAVNPGDAVRVSGLVSEFRAGGADGLANLTITEIVQPELIVLSAGNALPEPILVGAGGRLPPGTAINPGDCGSVEQSACGFDPGTDGIDFWESLEGMRVRIDNALATGPTNDFGEISVVADLGANAGPRTARGGVRITAGDFNPERVLLDDGFMPMPRVNLGDSFPLVIGVLDYSFGNFKLQVTEPLTVASGGLEREITRAQDQNQLAIASFNVENLAPGDPPEKLAALAAQIVQNLRSPDIVALMEVQDNSGAANDGTVDAALTFNLLAMAIETAGGPAYQFRSIDPVNGQDGGQPGGNIRVGFLFNPARVSFVDRPGSATAATGVLATSFGPRLSASPGRIEPGNAAFANSRKPLAAEFVFKANRVFVVANHFNSKGGDQPLFGRFQPPALVTEAQRMQQAEVVGRFAQSIFALDPRARVVVLGDLNDFEFSPPLAVLKAAGLHDLVEILPEEERYTYVFEGNSQVLDHILVSEALLQGVEYDVVHVNSEFADQASDHEPEVARLHLPARLDEVTRDVRARSSKLELDPAAGLFRGTITVTNQGKRPIEGPILVLLDRLERNVQLVNASGTRRGDPYVSALSDGGLQPRESVTVAVQFAATPRPDDDHRGHGHGELRGKDIDFDIRVFAGSF